MQVITAEYIRRFFDFKEINLKRRRGTQHNLVLIKYEDDEFDGEYDFKISVPAGFEAAVKKSDGSFSRVESKGEVYFKEEVRAIWIIRLEVNDIPWGVPGIVYDDPEKKCRLKFGASGQFGIKVSQAEHFPKIFGEPKELSDRDIRDKTKGIMLPVIEKILKRKSQKYTVQGINKEICADSIKCELNPLIDMYLLELINFTISRTVKNDF